MFSVTFEIYLIDLILSIELSALLAWFDNLNLKYFSTRFSVLRIVIHSLKIFLY